MVQPLLLLDGLGRVDATEARFSENGVELVGLRTTPGGLVLPSKR